MKLLYLMSMVWIEPPRVFITKHTRNQMEKHHLTEEQILYAFNYPEKEIDTDYGKRREKKSGDYIVVVQCFWSYKEDRWLITSCWKY